jgi:RNA polymerase-associated protein
MLFSLPSCWLSHRVRFVLAEKGLSVTICDVDLNDPPEDLLNLNPYKSLPTLVDHDLVLYESQVIIEYLDERFPHPPLLPADPVNRARFRLALSRIETDWYSLLRQLESPSGDETQRGQVRKALRDSLTASAAMFKVKPFFLSEDFSLIDCSLGPLLWRLSHYGIGLPSQALAVMEYAEKLFCRPSFRLSLSAVEKRMRS